jgi:hypothetical protein
MGMALKMFDIGGPTLLDDEPDTRTFDYANISGPIFFCNTVDHYLFIQNLFIQAPSYFAQGRPGAHRFFSDFITGKGTLNQADWAWDELLALMGLMQLPSVKLPSVTASLRGCARTPRGAEGSRLTLQRGSE